jgi:integrase
VIEPDHPENPFESKVRFRNYLILGLLLDLGIRRGELLGIRIEDCRFGSTEPSPCTGGQTILTIPERCIRIQRQRLVFCPCPAA